MIPVTVVVGNPKPNSRTRGVALTATWGLCRCLAQEGVPVAPPELIDLTEVSAELVGHGARADVLEEMLRTVGVPGGLLVVASPTFKSSYSGLLKIFIDLLPRGGLHGVVAVPLMTAASPSAQDVVEHLLRPLLLELGADVPAPGLCVMEGEFGVVQERLDKWFATVVPGLSDALRASVSCRPPQRSSAVVG
ncbi:MAG TPA: NAD(P)H-dependent oxidoreductase [Streptosporangiaceae bacterium]|nr:NAD(P)H-dependent oxidoreductase [Streptosporangiaceae bacterium]